MFVEEMIQARVEFASMMRALQLYTAEGRTAGRLRAEKGEGGGGKKTEKVSCRKKENLYSLSSKIFHQSLWQPQRRNLLVVVLLDVVAVMEILTVWC